MDPVSSKKSVSRPWSSTVITGQVPIKLRRVVDAVKPAWSRSHAGLTAWAGRRFPPVERAGPGLYYGQKGGGGVQPARGSVELYGRVHGTVSKLGYHQAGRVMGGAARTVGDRW